MLPRDLRRLLHVPPTGRWAPPSIKGHSSSPTTGSPTLLGTRWGSSTVTRGPVPLPGTANNFLPVLPNGAYLQVSCETNPFLHLQRGSGYLTGLHGGVPWTVHRSGGIDHESDAIGPRREKAVREEGSARLWYHNDR